MSNKQIFVSELKAHEDANVVESLRKELDWCHEIIKVLEHQRNIFRSHFLNCNCSCKKTISEFSELSALDEEIEQIYQRDEGKQLRKRSSRRKQNLSSREDTFTVSSSSEKNDKEIQTSMLGIDLNSFKHIWLKNPQIISETLRINKRTVQSSRSSKQGYSCKYPKCRYKAFTAKSFSKHKLEHQRSQFIKLVMPIGFTLNDFFEIVPIDPKMKREQIKMEHCCFHSCDYEPSSESRLEFIIDHLTEHISSYIQFACLTCNQIFSSKFLLHEHLLKVLNCAQESILNFNYNFWSDEEIEQLKQFINCSISMNSTSNNDRLETNRVYCQFCNSSYISKSLLDVHVKLIHNNNLDHNSVKNKIPTTDSEHKQTKEVIKTSVDCDDENINGKTNLKCRLCFKVFDTFDSIQKHVQTFHNLVNSEAVITPKSGSNLISEPKTQTTISISEECYSSNDSENNNSTLLKDLDEIINEKSKTVNDEKYITIDDENEDQSKVLNYLPVVLDNDVNNSNSNDEIMVLELVNNANGDIELIQTKPISKNGKTHSNIESADSTSSSTTGESISKSNTDMESNECSKLQNMMNAFIYDCHLCTFSFRTENELAKHTFLYHKISSFCCKSCDFVTQDIEIYRKHEQFHRLNYIFQCKICFQMFSTSEVLADHNKANHVNVQCSICKLVLANRTLLTSHMVSYHRDLLFKCDQCSYKTYIKENFTKHKLTHSKNTKICPFTECGESFATDIKLDAHINKIHIQKPIHKCTETDCTESFYNSEQLQKHKINIHNHYIYKCSQTETCTFQTNSERVLKMHHRVHSEQRPFKCTELDCEYSSRTKGMLNSHFRHKHISEKSLICGEEGCLKNYKTNAQLVQHQKRIHLSRSTEQSELNWDELLSETQSSLTNTKPYKCPYEGCFTEYAKHTELTKHLTNCVYRKKFRYERCQKRRSNKKMKTLNDTMEEETGQVNNDISIIMEDHHYPQVQTQQMDITTEIATITGENQFTETL